MNSFFLKSINQAKRLIIAIVGFTVLLIGLAMIVLPGPAFIVIPVGLGILAIEFAWARRLLKRVKYKIQNFKKGGITDETK
ncbi:MAG: PGPGW domain-containing protein [Thermodesulfovibrionales bacterium]|nr:PGPGW domain-containing protein [Thermodesulfovibrionales bacterium]